MHTNIMGKRKKYLMVNFIEKYDNTLPKEICEYFIDFFESEDALKYTHHATAGPKEMNLKDAQDLNLRNPSPTNSNPEKYTTKKHLDMLSRYDSIINSKFVEYQKKYHVDFDGNKDWWIWDEDCFHEDYINHPLMHRYEVNKQGYHAWHQDWAHTNHRLVTRKLVAMAYLNDVHEGGETEFFHQKVKIKPKQGTLVVWPAYFTHIHKGNIPISNTKYIVNKWCILVKPAGPKNGLDIK